MSVKDSNFVHFMEMQLGNKMLFTVQEKCLNYLAAKNKNSTTAIGQKIVDVQFNKLTNEREKIFRSYFAEAGVEKQIKFKVQQNTVPYNGFSFYKITYKGDIPESLKDAYQQMNELNNEPPRRKNKEKREKI